LWGLGGQTWSDVRTLVVGVAMVGMGGQKWSDVGTLVVGVVLVGFGWPTVD